jgi:hypothetical protein
MTPRLVKKNGAIASGAQIQGHDVSGCHRVSRIRQRNKPVDSSFQDHRPIMQSGFKLPLRLLSWVVAFVDSVQAIAPIPLP